MINVPRCNVLTHQDVDRLGMSFHQQLCELIVIQYPAYEKARDLADIVENGLHMRGIAVSFDE